MSPVKLFLLTVAFTTMFILLFCVFMTIIYIVLTLRKIENKLNSKKEYF